MPNSNYHQKNLSAHQLFENYFRLVPFLVNKITCHSDLITQSDREDIISRTYIVLWEICLKQSQINAESFKSYLYIRIKGSIIDELRKKKRIFEQAIYYTNYLTQLLESKDNFITQENTPFSSTNREELKSFLDEALKKLSPKEQIVISEFYLQEKRFCQIVQEHEGLSKSWVSKIHRQALKKLRELVPNLSTTDIYN